jgi:hypothetical protein
MIHVKKKNFNSSFNSPPPFLNLKKKQMLLLKNIKINKQMLFLKNIKIKKT